MAWIRTALSMIGFGFSIYKFFQYLPEEIATGNIKRPQAPRNLGMSLIALGTLALSAAAWQHRNFLNEIGTSQTQRVSISFVVAIFVILIGFMTFYGVLLRHGPFSKEGSFSCWPWQVAKKLEALRHARVARIVEDLFARLDGPLHFRLSSSR